MATNPVDLVATARQRLPIRGLQRLDVSWPTA